MNIATTFRRPLVAAKQSPTFGGVYRVIKDFYIQAANKGKSRIDVLSSFPMFIPNSGGTYTQRAPLSIQAINDLVPGLIAFGESVGGRPVAIMTDAEYASKNGDGRADDLATLFTKYGSDKATTHGYYRVYASILASGSPTKIMEIGLGTNMVDIVSNMGLAGRPGASLRAFRDFLPEAQVYGADVDKRVLFSEERIKTFHVDQTDRQSFVALGMSIPADDFDLMIDDGLHLPNANINSLTFFLPRLKVGGHAVIEDIPPVAEGFWHLVGQMLPAKYEACLVRSGSSFLFVVKRISS